MNRLEKFLGCMFLPIAFYIFQHLYLKAKVALKLYQFSTISTTGKLI